LGVDVAVPDAALKAQLNLPEDRGLTVTQVPEDSIGAQAGLKVHDVIVELDGQGVSEPLALARLLDGAAGKSVKIKLWRAGKQTELQATPKKPEYARVKLSNILLSDFDRDTLASAERYRIGVTLSETDDTLHQQLRLAAGEGLVVTEVVEGSAAAQAGLQVSDVLTMLDGKRLTTVEAINAQIQELKDKPVELRLLRGGKETTIQIAARKSQEAADRPLVYWSTKSCQNCHVADASHQALAIRLGADWSALTDGHHTRLWHYEKAYRAQTEAGAQQPAESAGPQQQVEKTLMALEQAIADSTKVVPPPEGDKK
jgi:C-terminal processing protease CtpA/Prc